MTSLPTLAATGNSAGSTLLAAEVGGSVSWEYLGVTGVAVIVILLGVIHRLVLSGIDRRLEYVEKEQKRQEQALERLLAQFSGMQEQLRLAADLAKAASDTADETNRMVWAIAKKMSLTAEELMGKHT